MSRRRTILSTLIRTSAVAAVGATTVLVATPASAAAIVTKASLNGTDLSIEGRGIWDRPITVDGVVMATSDAAGNFKIARRGYTAPADCSVDVNDGSARPMTVLLAGCTPTAPGPTMLPDTPELGSFTVGVQPATTTVNFAGAIGPTSWQIVAGALPTGLSLVVPVPVPLPRQVPPEQVTYALIQGTPTAAGISTVTFKSTDVRGLTATRTYTIRVNPALPVSITPEPWPPAIAGSFTNLWIDGGGGLRPYRWAVTAGALPPGMSLIQDAPDGPSIRVGGTPTSAGTYDWTLQLTDAQGATTSRAFTATVGEPAPAPAPAPEPAPAPQPAPVAVSIASVSLAPATVTGGTSSTGTVTVSTAAPSGGTAVILSSSNPLVAAVPATVTVPAGATSATFPVTTTAVGATTPVSIDATYSGTLTASLTVTAAASATPADSVSIGRAEYDSAKGVLRVDAASSGSGATLKVYATGTGTLIGSLSGGTGSFSLSANPQNITVRSSIGGSASRAVTAK